MDFDALRHANFALLDAAITDWGTLVRNLETLKTDAENGLHKKANKAEWAGVNAQVSKEFIDKTAKEFVDAHTQATTIHNILRDTCDELKGYHGQLLQAIERGEKKGIKVVSGKGTFTVSARDSSGGEGDTEGKPTQADIDSLRDELQAIIDKATESDTSAKTVLQAISDQSKLGFSDASYKDRDSAEAVIKAADELAKLARKNPQDLTVADFDKLNAGLKKYAGDELFAEEFATQLGPKKTLEFWAGINDPHRADWDLAHKRRNQFDDLQRNLSLTLAHATQSDSTAMTEWKRKMIDLGDKAIYGNRGGPMGFQVMSNLMRTGDYDDQFLEDYGTKLMATERKLTDNGRHGNGAWQYLGVFAPLNQIGEDSGYDPLTGYLKALSNSPDAATEFFNQQYVSKDDPDNPFERDPDGSGEKKPQKVSLSNFQYLFEEREWPQETDSHGDEIITGKNNLALALEAATTGHPAGVVPVNTVIPHNVDQAKLFQAIVSSVADDPERLTKNGYMSDSMGQIASEYLPDINRAATDVDAHADAKSWQAIERLYPVAGEGAVLNHRDVTKFLFAVGQNEEGYAAVEVGQNSYMAKLMEHHLDPDLPTDQRFSQDTKTTVRYISGLSGEISGTLGLGRQEALGEEAAQKDKDFDYAISQYKNLISGSVGTAVGVGTSTIATPWVGAAIGGGAGTVTSVVLERVFKDAEGHALEETADDMGDRWQSSLSQNNEYVALAARTAADKYHLSNSDDLTIWARESARQGYFNARSIVDGQAPGSITNFT
ncbi:hypothetical protein ABZX83_26475 [Streptomyces thermoviolaceus]|uniref:hypothetical protein n=1 Tax=Streptomyces thermoviolaceus TaxID=1952 RepID=UPI0033A29BD2